MSPQVWYGPTKGSCSMMGLVDADVVLLDDYRPDCQLVDIATMLSWLESGTITICRPLNLYGSHLQYKAEQPHFMTCSFSALHSPRGRMSEVELAMLRSRLKLYVFQRRLPQIRDIRPCPNCFAMFVLSAGRDVSKFVDQGFPRVARAAVSN